MSHELSDIDCGLFNSALIVAKEKGDDAKSNAVGKSTIFHALEYALYGTYPTELLEQIVRDGADKCTVELIFQNQGEHLKVLRGRSAKGRSDLRLWRLVAGKWVSISERTMPDTDKKLAGILGISQKAFRYSVMYGQNDISALASAKKPEHRKEILKEPLQLAIYSKLEKAAKKKMADSKTELITITGTTALLGRPDLERKDSEIDLKDIKIKIETVSNKITKIDSALTSDKALYISLSSSLTNKSKQIQEKYHETNERIKTVSVELTTKKTSLVSSIKDLNTASGKLEIIQIELQQIKDTREKCVPDTASKKKLESKLSQAEQDYINGKEIIAKLESKISDLENVLPHEETCTHCFQKITEEYRKEFRQFREEQIQKLTVKYNSLKESVDSCKEKKLDIKKRIAEYIALENKYNDLNYQIELKAGAIINLNEHIQYLASHNKDIKNEADILESSYQKLKEASKSFEVQLAKDPEKETSKKIIDLSTRITKGEGTLEKYQEVLNDLKGTKTALTSRIEKLKLDENKIQNLIKKTKDLKHTIHLQKIVVQAFGPSGVPALMIRSILDELQWESNAVLQSLRPEMEINFSANLDMSYQIRGATRVYDQLSGGQKVYVALSLKMALSKIIQRKVGVDIGILALDEVDQSLDKAGVEAFAEVIKRWEKDFKIFVITHNDSLKDKFSHAILVEGDGNGTSSAQVVNNW